MKIGTNRIILSCVFSCLAFVLTTNGDAQLRSIVFAQSEGAGVAQLSQEELSPRLNDQRVMHVNQPSDDSSVFATSHLSEPEQLPPSPRGRADAHLRDQPRRNEPQATDRQP